MGIITHIDLTAKDRTIVKSLLKRFLPNTIVWAFGSRVKFTSRPESDLDLTAFIKLGQKIGLNELKEAFDESNLPFRVDIHDWNGIPENFKRNIEKEYVVVQADEEREEQVSSVQELLMPDNVDTQQSRRASGMSIP